MKYIVLGKTGYIGEAFVNYFNTISQPYVALSRSDKNYTNVSVFKDYLESIRDDDIAVINCAGYIGKPNVDACEGAKAETIAGNVVFPAQLATTCEQLEIPLIHISSGCIYGGYEKDFTEMDKPNFTFPTGSFYSGTKALAETLVASNCSRYYIYRLRIPFDHICSPRNYITKLLTYDRLLDMRNSVSHRYDFVKYCHKLTEQRVPYGIYNVTNRGSITTRDVVDMLHNLLPAQDKVFTFFDTIEQFGNETVAPRSNCVLNTDKIEKYIDIRTANQAMEHAILRYKDDCVAS